MVQIDTKRGPATVGRRGPRTVAGIVAIAAVAFGSGCTAPDGDDGPALSASPAAATIESESGIAAADSVTGLAARSAPEASTPPAAEPSAPPPRAGAPKWITLAPGLRARPAAGAALGRVEVDAVACLDRGWLEQIVCLAGTREHESLAFTLVSPSSVHAALLLAGFEPGRPGRWTQPFDGPLRLDPPLGDTIQVRFRWSDPDGTERLTSPEAWIVGEHGGRLSEPEWRFGGSRVVNRRGGPVAPGDEGLYLADFAGSLIGLVTFGDETIGLTEVIPDAAEVFPEAWMVDMDAVPEPGTPIVVVLQARGR